MNFQSIFLRTISRSPKEVDILTQKFFIKDNLACNKISWKKKNHECNPTQFSKVWAVAYLAKNAEKVSFLTKNYGTLSVFCAWYFLHGKWGSSLKRCCLLTYYLGGSWSLWYLKKSCTVKLVKICNKIEYLFYAL